MTITFCDIEDLKSSGELINAIREKTKNCYDLKELKRIAFNDIKLPKRKYMATKRSFYVKQITSKFSPTSVDRIECSSQWFRRRSAQLFGFNSHEHKVVISSDRSKVAVLRKTYRSLCEILLLLEDKSESVLQTYWSLKNAVIIGITNNGKRLVFSHCSSKTTSKVKNDIRIDLIGVNFDAFEGFYLEESDSAIIICNSGLVSKCKVTKKQFETIMITNDKNLNIVSAHLNPDCGLVWLDSVSHQRTHTFIAFDANNLDVFTVIQTDFFAIDKFSVNPCDNKSVIVVKSDPINGRLRKVMNILSNSSKVKRISDSLDDVLDINCLTVSSDNRLPENECLIVLVTRNSFDIYVEYRYKSVWKKRIVFLDNTNVSELKTIKIIKVCATMAECSVTLLVISNDPHIVRLDIRLEQL